MSNVDAQSWDKMQMNCCHVPFSDEYDLRLKMNISADTSWLSITSGGNLRTTFQRSILTHCDLVTLITTCIWVCFGAGNGLFSYDTKPLPGPRLTRQKWVPVTDKHLRVISNEIAPPSITKINLQISYLRIHSYLITYITMYSLIYLI